MLVPAVKSDTSSKVNKRENVARSVKHSHDASNGQFRYSVPWMMGHVCRVCAHTLELCGECPDFSTVVADAASLVKECALVEIDVHDSLVNSATQSRGEGMGRWAPFLLGN